MSDARALTLTSSVVIAIVLTSRPTPVSAHASQQSFVLLLPTDFYITAGVCTVILTLLVISIMPPRAARALFRPRPLWRSRGPRLQLITSTLSFLVLCAILCLGYLGTSDPTRNPVPAYLWTLIWIIAVLIQGLAGDIWRYLSPWTGPLAVMRALGLHPALPLRITQWPALLSLFAFAYLLLVSPRANDPPTLIAMVSGYWFAHFVLGLVFGPKWLARGEAVTVMMRAYRMLTVWGLRGGKRSLGMPGWQALARPDPTPALALFMIALLAIGSFDGFYRTFTWFSWIGQNPLMFEGRTAVLGINMLGLLVAVPTLTLIYAICLWLGFRLIGRGDLTRIAFTAFAPSLLPIALAYHFAHYLPALLVEAQALPIIANDPLGSGANLFGWAHLEVTTGFFNRLDTVRPIWLAQASGVVAGHVIAILMSHVIALRLVPSHRDAAISQLPIATFMILYTLFGLWLLASPQGA